MITRAALVGGLLLASTAWADQPGMVEWRYTIRPGDTLIGISANYLANPLNWPALQKLNRIAQPRRLPPGSVLRIPIAGMLQQPGEARVEAANGDARAQLPGEPGMHALTAGTALPAGSEVETGDRGVVVLVFADGSRLRLQPQSRLALDIVSVYAGGGMVDTRARLQHGRVELEANPVKKPGNRLEVQTPSALAAVRGTRFRVSADDAVMHEETVEGLVGVSAQQTEVKVAQAQGTVAETGKPPATPVALLPSPDTSTLPALLEHYPLRFPLPAMNGAVAWQGQIAPDTQFANVLLEQRVTGPVLVFPDLPNGNYFLRLRAIDALGLQGLDGLHAFAVHAHPFAPLLTDPADKAQVRNDQPRLAWTRSTEAAAYQVQVAHDEAFTRLVDDVASTPENEFRVTKPLGEGTYFWRAASLTDTGVAGPWTNSQRFAYKALPHAPELKKPAQFAADTLSVPLPSIEQGQHYELLFARDQQLKDIFWQGAPQNNAAVMPRPPAGQYFLAVRAVEQDGTAGPYGIQVINVPSNFPQWLIPLAPALMLLL
jgi:hypothetical protein